MPLRARRTLGVARFQRTARCGLVRAHGTHTAWAADAPPPSGVCAATATSGREGKVAVGTTGHAGAVGEAGVRTGDAGCRGAISTATAALGVAGPAQALRIRVLVVRASVDAEVSVLEEVAAVALVGTAAAAPQRAVLVALWALETPGGVYAELVRLARVATAAAAPLCAAAALDALVNVAAVDPVPAEALPAPALVLARACGHARRVWVAGVVPLGAVVTG